VPKRICAVLYVSVMGITRCYKTTVFTFIFSVFILNLFYGCILLHKPIYCVAVFKFLTVQAVKRVELRHHAKFRLNRLKRGQGIAIYRFFKMAAAAILDLKKNQIFNGRGGLEGRTASSCQISSKSVKPWPKYGAFRFFKMAVAAILDFRNFKFLTVGTVKGVELRHYAKFR